MGVHCVSTAVLVFAGRIEAEHLQLTATMEIERLKKKLIQVQSRQRWVESGGSVKDWDAGVSNSVMAKLKLDANGDLVGWAAAVAQPGMERHLDPERAATTPTTQQSWDRVAAIRQEQGRIA